MADVDDDEEEEKEEYDDRRDDEGEVAVIEVVVVALMVGGGFCDCLIPHASPKLTIPSFNDNSVSGFTSPSMSLTSIDSRIRLLVLRTIIMYVVIWISTKSSPYGLPSS